MNSRKDFCGADIEDGLLRKFNCTMSRKELCAIRDFEHFWDPLGEKERSVGQFVLSEEERRVHELSEL